MTPLASSDDKEAPEMDATISDDPKAPDAPEPPGFPAARWARAGATMDERNELRAAYGAMPVAEQVAEANAIGSGSDGAMSAALDHMRAEGEFGGFRTASAVLAASEATQAAPEAKEPSEEGRGIPDGTTSDNAEEAAAAHGPWNPAEEALDVDGNEYPAWNLEGGWVGTVVGDDKDGVHLIAPNRDALIERVKALLAEQS